jgi:hypothetical protein
MKSVGTPTTFQDQNGDRLLVGATSFGFPTCQSMTEPEEKLTGSLRISTQCKFIESIVGMANTQHALFLQGRQLGGQPHGPNQLVQGNNEAC